MAETISFSPTALRLARRVFGIPKLWEDILVRLPFKDLTSMSEVSDHWKIAMEASIQIKRKLFLEPDGDVVSPAMFRGPFPKTDAPIYSDSLDLHPIMDWFAPRDGKETLPSHPIASYSACCPYNMDPSIQNDPSVEVDYNQPLDPSKQFITQPPCTVVTLRDCLQRGPADLSVTVPVYVWNPVGVRLGDVFEVSRKMQACMRHRGYYDLDQHNPANDRAAFSIRGVSSQVSGRRGELMMRMGEELPDEKIWTEMILALAKDCWLEKATPHEESGVWDVGGRLMRRKERVRLANDMRPF